MIFANVYQIAKKKKILYKTYISRKQKKRK